MTIPSQLNKLYGDAAGGIILVHPEPSIKVLVTGSRDFTDEAIVLAVLGGLSHTYGALHITHGAARGLDTIARELAAVNSPIGWTEEGFVAEWGRYGNSAGNRRNIRMLAERQHDVCIGFPLFGSKGTWDMLTRAYDDGLPTYVVRDSVLRPFEERDRVPLWPYGREVSA